MRVLITTKVAGAGNKSTLLEVAEHTVQHTAIVSLNELAPKVSMPDSQKISSVYCYLIQCTLKCVVMLLITSNTTN